MPIPTSPATLTIDHLTILSRSKTASAAFYRVLLPQLGFTLAKPGIWHNASGLYLQFREAGDGTRNYERYGPGLNHVGFKAPSPEFVRHLASIMADAGYEARLQNLTDGVLALFIPDPDGLRIEVSWYPPGVPPVD
jgi:lactoylglutathione lyase